MTKIAITLISGLISAIFGALLFFFQERNPILMWVLYVGLAASMFVFELSLLTNVLDQLSFRPVLAIFMVLGSLTLFVLLGLWSRTLYADTLLYWLLGTVYPAIGGVLYIVDILQKQ